MWLMWLALLAVLAVLWVLTGPEPPPVLGLYRQPGRWYRLKYGVFLALMRLRQRRSRGAQSVTGADAGYGMKSRASIDAMDTVQALSPLHPLVSPPSSGLSHISQQICYVWLCAQMRN